MSEVLLIDPSHFYGEAWTNMPGVKHQLAALATFLESRGHTAEILDLEFRLGSPSDPAKRDRFIERAAREVDGYQFDVAGITCYSSMAYLASRAVGDVVKEVNPDCSLAVGGYHPVAVPSDFTYDGTPFDFMVSGEGETAMLAICDGEEVKGPEPRTLVGEVLPMDEIPFIDWERYNYIEDYEREMGVRFPQYVYLSRGCPFRCTFCLEKEKWRGWRSYTAERSLEYIDYMVDSIGGLSFAICDACFGVNRKWRREFLEGLIERDHTAYYSFETRHDILSVEDIRLFSRLQCHVEFGLEHGSPSMLRLLRKTGNVPGYLEKFSKISRECNRLGVLHRVNLLFNTPGETRDTVNESVDFIEGLMKGQKDTSGCYGAVGYQHYPGSYIDRHLEEFKDRFGTVIQYPDWWRMDREQRSLSRAVSPSSDIPLEESDYWKEAWSPVDDMIMEGLSDHAFRWFSMTFRPEWRGKRETSGG